MENLPAYVYITFIATVFLACWLFYKATSYSKTVLVAMTIWALLQSFAGIAGFYNNVNSMTMRFPLLLLPPLIFLLSLFFTKKGKIFIDKLNGKTLTILHIIRIPVELVLYWLFIHQSIPKALTFEGRNFDVFSGLTAPLVFYFGFVKNTIPRYIIIIWNIVCILLLLNVGINAILSLPARFQQFGFEVPNIGLGYFPFILLPALLVPMVLFSNLAVIVKLSRKRLN